MKILVIDDTPAERKAAAEQLTDHEVTFATKFSEGRDLIEKGGWDVVLTDLMMPGQSEGQGKDGELYIGEPTPYGFVLALLALKRVPKVAIVSYGNHHNHPLIWACDWLRNRRYDSKGGITHVVPGLWVFTGSVCPTKDEVKDWGKVLELITT